MSMDHTTTSACECSKGYVAQVCRMYNAERNYFAGQLQQHGQASQIEAALQAEQPRQLVN